MDEIIRKELSHIPQGDKYSSQNDLRMNYSFLRRSDLSKDPNIPARTTLFRAIQSIKNVDCSFVPEFDREFFEVE